MKKLVIAGMILHALLLYFPVFSQDDDEEKFYKTKLHLQVAPWFADMSPNNLPMGYDVELHGFIMKRFSFSGIYMKSGYFDIKDKANDPLSSDAYQGIKGFQNTQLNFRFHIFDGIRDGRIQRERVSLVSRSGGLYQKTEVSRTRGPVRKILSVRAGTYNWRTGTSATTDEQWHLKTSGTTTDVLATEKDYTTLTSSNLTAGLSFGKLVDGAVGGSSVRYFRNLALDFMVNTNVKLDDLKSKTGQVSAFQVGAGTMQKQSTGWRFVYEYYALGRRYLTAGWRMEFGKRPGIKERSNFLQITFSLGLKYAKK